MTEEETIRLHIAGATVRHKSPFEELESFRNAEELSREFLDQWVLPFYMRFGETSEAWIESLHAVTPEISADIIEKNLGDFNWRTRTTGAFFAAITNRPQYIDIIGTHLLKSETCCAGDLYCQVLAAFNIPACADYLNRYLDHYLLQPELWFDQADAMEAVLYLDEVNGTKDFERHYPKYLKFIENKPYWQRTIRTDSIRARLKVIHALMHQPE
jgi:hypothetical protein